jgi:hypothetical protein
MDKIMAIAFILTVYGVLALRSVRSAQRARRFRSTGRWD